MKAVSASAQLRLEPEGPRRAHRGSPTASICLRAPPGPPGSGKAARLAPSKLTCFCVFNCCARTRAQSRSRRPAENELSLHGPKPGAEKHSQISHCQDVPSLLVGSASSLPTRSEGLGISIPEAMAMLNGHRRRRCQNIRHRQTGIVRVDEFGAIARRKTDSQQSGRDRGHAPGGS